MAKTKDMDTRGRDYEYKEGVGNGLADSIEAMSEVEAKNIVEAINTPGDGHGACVLGHGAPPHGAQEWDGSGASIAMALKTHRKTGTMIGT